MLHIHHTVINIQNTCNMKNIKQQLAYMWKHREAAIGLIIMLLVFISGLIILEAVIEEIL